MADLYAKLRALQLIADEAAAAVEDCHAEIEEAEGHPLAAAWRRARAESLRHPSDETHAASHRAFLVHMAASHLKSGTVPKPGSHEAAAIEATMDEIRADPVRVGWHAGVSP